MREYEVIKELRKCSEKTAPGILEGVVVQTNPLTISLFNGEVMAPPMALECLFCAQGFYRKRGDGHLYLESWQIGDRAAVCMMGQKLVVLGHLASPEEEIKVR